MDRVSGNVLYYANREFQVGYSVYVYIWLMIYIFMYMVKLFVKVLRQNHLFRNKN